MKHSSLCVFLFVAVAAASAALQAQTPTFSAPKQMPSNIPNNWDSDVIYAGNFNGNGNTDLIVGIEGPPPANPPPEFLSGNGAGAFTQTGSAPPFLLRAITLVGDFNGDGKEDVITLIPACEQVPCGNWPNNQSSTDGIFLVSLGQGNGFFGGGYIDTLPAHDDVVEGLVADFNKDGKPDVAVLATPGGDPYYSATPYLVIFLNQGNGSFTQTDYALPVELSSYPAATNLVAGDFEGNGNLDLAFAYASAYGTPPPYPQLLTFAGDGKGHFGPAVISYTFNTGINYLEFNVINYGTQHTSLFASDLNGDGRTDLVISLNPTRVGGNASVVTLLANSQGRFHWGSSVSLDPSVQNVILTDVNGDGHPDLVFIGNKTSPSGTSSEYAGIYLGTATGAFQTPHIPLSVPGTGPQPTITAAPFKPGALPNLFVSGAKSVALMYINTTKE